jgi:hypothetical protein
LEQIPSSPANDEATIRAGGHARNLLVVFGPFVRIDSELSNIPPRAPIPIDVIAVVTLGAGRDAVAVQANLFAAGST